VAAMANKRTRSRRVNRGHPHRLRVRGVLDVGVEGEDEDEDEDDESVEAARLLSAEEVPSVTMITSSFCGGEAGDGEVFRDAVRLRVSCVSLVVP